MPESFIMLLKKHPTINSQFRSGERKVLCEETEGTPSTAQKGMSIMSPTADFPSCPIKAMKDHARVIEQPNSQERPKSVWEL